MADAQPTAVPEDETFLSEEDLFEEAYRERYGVEDDEQERQTAEAGNPAPERYASADEGKQRAQESGEGQDSGATGQEEPPEEEPEWLKALPEEARQALEQREQELASLRDNYNAIHNRLAPVQQENARLRQQLSSNTRPAQTPDSGSVPVGQASQPSFSLGDVEEFKEFQDAFPDEAKALEAVFARQNQTIGHLHSQLGNVSRGLQEIQQTSFASQREAELSRLSQAHPDWATVRPSDDFAQWLGVQPPSISQMANSPKADDCIWLLDRYKADAFLAQQFAQQGEQQPAQPQQANRAQQTRSRRQQMRSVPGGRPQQDGGVGAPQSGGQPLSDEEIWEQEFERRMRAQREANR